MKATTVEEDLDATATAASRSDMDNPAFEEWLLKNHKSPWAEKKEVVLGDLTKEQKKYAQEYIEKKDKEERGGKGRGERVEQVNKSTFHGKERDYHRPSWIAPPKDAKATNDHCPQAVGTHVEQPHEGHHCHLVLPQA